jgi:hypothetical protein
MQSFVDSKDRTWTIELNYDTMRRIQADTRIDMTRPFLGLPHDSVFNQVNDSVLTMLAVLWSICRLRADEVGAKRAYFESAIEGEPLEKAREALLEEWRLFFQRNRRLAEAEFVAEQTAIHKKLSDAVSAARSNGVSASPELSV